MKKEYILIVLALSIAVVYYFFGTQHVSVRNYPPKNDIIVAFGDSLVEGRGSTPGNDFVSLLSRKIHKPILNLGVAGNTTEDGLGRLDDVLKQNPGTVIVLFGGNDYIRNIPRERTFENLRQIISTLQQDGVFVILLGIQGGILTDSYESSFDALAQETNVLYVPNVLGGLFGNPKFMSEVVHPNDLGYAKIADKIYNIIAGYIW
ncbi:MAG: GDSL-type esterase/lipase family protein [Patescibacteria group bacterium]